MKSTNSLPKQKKVLPKKGQRFQLWHIDPYSTPGEVAELHRLSRQDGDDFSELSDDPHLLCFSI